MLAGCTTGPATPDAASRACIILPDSASSPRWESGDRPALEAAFTAAGFESDIQNAQGDTAKYATIAEQQLSKGCGVMILVDYQGAGIQVTANAQKQGIPVIAVKENRNLMRNRLEGLPFAPGKLFVVDSYLEAVGVMVAIRAGVAPAAVRRPLGPTRVLTQAPRDPTQPAKTRRRGRGAKDGSREGE